MFSKCRNRQLSSLVKVIASEQPYSSYSNAGNARKNDTVIRSSFILSHLAVTNSKELIRTGEENITSSTGSRASVGGRPCSSGFSCRKCGLGALCQSFPEGSGLHYSHVSCQTPDNLLLTDSICVPCRSCTLASSQPNTFLAPDIFCVRF